MCPLHFVAAHLLQTLKDMKSQRHVLVNLFLGWGLIAIAADRFQGVAAGARPIANAHIPIRVRLVPRLGNYVHQRSLVMAVIYFVYPLRVW